MAPHFLKTKKRQSGNFFYFKACAIGLVLAVISWCVETLLHAYLFNEHSFSHEFWPNNFNEFWMRSFIAAMFFCSTLVFAFLYRRQAEVANTLYLTYLALDSINEGALITNRDNKIVYVNQRYKEISGFEEDDVIGKNPNVLSSGRQNKAFYQALWKELSEMQFWQGEIWNRKKNGEYFPEWLSIRAIVDENHNPEFYVAIFSDISAQKAEQEQIKHYAFYDPLTDIPNRHFFNETLHRALARSERTQETIALLFLDLDKFKPVNDNYGHDVGDQLLVEIAIRLKSILRADDFLARLGGDEFIIMLNLSEDKEAMRKIVNRCLEVIARPFMIDGISIDIGVSIGVACSNEVGSNANALLNLADKRMYKAKNSRKNEPVFTN